MLVLKGEIRLNNKRSKKLFAGMVLSLFLCAAGCYEQSMLLLVFGYVCLLAAIVRDVRDFFSSH